MKFIDEAIITVQSGDGGRGCVSFRREKYIPRGGPDGGDGGRGGDVLLKASSQKRTLYHFRNQKHFKAERGGYGQGQQKSGRNGEDLIIEVPPGTIVFDQETETVLHDFVHTDETFVVAKGGRGGQGNKRFATSTNRAPRFAQPGEPGQTLTLRLELKLLAEVGIIGFPNAGKSTLISRISSARPKIADYPFTTLVPNLGMVKPEWGEPFAVADIPGLIEGAHSGVGLGVRFLRHIERTRWLVHLIDAASLDPADIMYHYRTINRELESYSRNLAEKPQILVLNKMDLSGTDLLADDFAAAFPDRTVFRISAVTGKGVRDLIRHLTRMINQCHGDQPLQAS
ncbi:MAG: GTPase ObgE [Thermodesulfobacteriota bacterium]